MQQKELEIIANKELSEFLVTLNSLKPSELVRLELYLFRIGKLGRTKDVLQTGLINCGNDYYDY